MKKSFALIAAIALTSLSFGAKPDQPDTSKLPAASTQKDVTYDKDIKPIFSKSCFNCHGAEKHKGKLRLDSLDATLKGGENAPDVVASDSAKSPLVWAVARIGDEDDAMPPKMKNGKVNALSKEQVALIRAWIDQGAK